MQKWKKLLQNTKIVLLFLFVNYVEARTTYEQILQNKKTINKEFATELAYTIDYYADKYKVPANVMTAIFMVESSYNLKAVNMESGGAGDYGIGQISSWNITTYNLNRNRLVTDLQYSVNWSFHIFEWLYSRMPLREAIMRYNCGFLRDKKTNISCTNWDNVIDYYEKVLRYM